MESDMHPIPRRQLLAGFLLFASAPRLAKAAEPAYPSKPVTIVVPFPPGGPSDAIVRAIAEQLGQRLGRPYVTDFKGGAAGILGTDAVAKAAPDGHMLLAASSDMLVNNTATFKQLPFDPLRDLTLVTQVGSLPLVLAVHAGVPVNDLADLAVYARQQRGQFGYGSWGQGTHAHLAAEWLLNRRLGADAVHAVYRGLAPMTQDLVGQRLAVAFGVAPAFAPFVQAGKLKVIAVTGSSRVAAFPQARTFAEQGYTDEIFQFRLWMALAAPAGTPRAVVDRLHREMAPIIASPPLQALLANGGFEPVLNTPEQARAALERELATVPRLVREIGVPLQ
jgi:tripartite-type tricarboxylate transporter receptor subunit TctC